MKLAFTVYGKPQPQGSARAFLPKGWTRPVITTDNANLKPWRQQVTGAAIEAVKDAGGEIADRDTPVFLRLTFHLQRPASLPKRFTRPTKKPDFDKLVRAVCDSLTGIAFEDDAQVVECVVSKQYGSPERVEIEMSTICEAVPKTPSAEAPQLFDFTPLAERESAVPKPDVFEAEQHG